MSPGQWEEKRKKHELASSFSPLSYSLFPHSSSDFILNEKFNMSLSYLKLFSLDNVHDLRRSLRSSASFPQPSVPASRLLGRLLPLPRTCLCPMHLLGITVHVTLHRSLSQPSNKIKTDHKVNASC